MVSAKRCREIMKKHGHVIAWRLGISKKTQSLIRGIITTQDAPDKFGLTTWYNNDKIKIEIFNKRHNSEREVLMTLYHELLHVKLHDLKIKLRSDKEERLIQGIERVTKYVLHENTKI